MGDDQPERRQRHRRVEDVDLRELRSDVRSVSNRLDALTQRFDLFGRDSKEERGRIRKNQHEAHAEMQRFIAAMHPVVLHFQAQMEKLARKAARRVARISWWKSTGRTLLIWCIGILGTGLAGTLTGLFDRIFTKGPPAP